MTSDGFYTLGVCATSLDQPRYETLMRQLQKESSDYKTHLVTFACFNDMTYQDSYDQGEKSIFQIIPYDSLDGLVLFTESFKDRTIPEEISKQSLARQLPTISVDADLEGCCNISFAYGEAFEQIVEHIITVHGCRRINLIAGVKDNPFEIERTQAFRRTLEKHGIPIEEARIDYGDFWDYPTQLVIDRMMASSLPLPEAIICENDSMAIAACQQLKKYNLSVPDDILVTGLDGIEFSKKHTPRLTTAEQDYSACVQRIFSTFTKMVQQESVSMTHRIPFVPCYEQSCGCRRMAINDVNDMLITELLNWNDAKHYDLHMKNMQNDVIRLRYRDMIPRLERYIPNEGSICLRTDFNSILDATPDYGSYDNSLSAFTPQMNAVVTRRNWYCTYNQFFPLSELLADLDDRIIQGDGLLFVPLHFQEITFGYFAVALNSEHGKFDMIRRFVGSMSIVLQVVQQQEHVRILNRQMEATNQKLTDLYNLDPLTGIMNRRGFHDHINRLLAEHDISKKQFILLSIDMDGLKTINDTYGHKEGDFSLYMISDGLKHLCRQYEEMACARFGGDEFIAAGFFDADQDVLPGLQEFFVSQMNFLNEVSGKEYTVGASVGCVVIPPGEAFDIESFINQADTLMYKNKHSRKKRDENL